MLALILAAAVATVPKGEVTKHTFTNSTVFPGTTRDYWLYVPAQYDPAKPTCVHVNQDGIQFNAPAVFDQLIAAKEMPVTVGIFVTPGVVKALSTNALDRFNRSYEYDSVNDNYARFLLDELLPHIVRTHKLNLSANANDRSIGGSSSGAICAFTVAWERPDAFRRVFSAIGTYVGLRGGDAYPTLIRKTEPKPLRVFLQDGCADLNIYGGDWWMANQTMERALTFAGYEVNHAWGEGGHNGKQATEIFPDAMRWLWKDWPAPVKAGQTKNAMLNDILLPGEDWQLVCEGYREISGIAANEKGEIVFTDGPNAYRISLDGKASSYPYHLRPAKTLAFGPDGRMYCADGEDIFISDVNGKTSDYGHLTVSKSLVVSHKGVIYYTRGPRCEIDCAWVDRDRGGQDVGTSGHDATGIALSPDHSLLYVSDRCSPWIDSFQIQANGSLTNGQKYCWLHSPEDKAESGAGGMCVDRDGRLYVRTALGVQICDQAGRVNCILPVPNTFFRISAWEARHPHPNVCTFGGENLDTLFVTCGNSIFKRKLKVKGVLPFQPPVKPSKPRL
jgi:enterochelin esterase-like enzyme/sugar lactone lactonase YvrE